MNALGHPNVRSKNSRLFPGAISYENFIDRLEKECHELAGDDEKHKAFEYNKKLYVPDEPLFSVGILGRYPDQSDYALFNSTDLENLKLPIEDDLEYKIAIGVDPAKYGNCKTAFAVRRGPNLIHVEELSGYSLTQTAAHAKRLALKYAGMNDPKKIPIYVDAVGLGEGLMEMSGQGYGKYNFIAIKGSHKAISELAEERYQNRRTQLYINLRNLAREKKISMAMLPQKDQHNILKQLRIPEFTVTQNGKTALEKKEDIIERLGASVDLADSITFAYYLGGQHFEDIRPL
jgi:hypothetical protein